MRKTHIWKSKAGLLFATLILSLVPCAGRPVRAQVDPKRLERERERGLQMLKGTKELIKENYYDPNFHGMDLEARFKAAEEKMMQADSLDGFKPTRNALWKMKYNYNLLRPQPGIRVVVQSPGAEPRQLDLRAQVVKTDRAINLEQIRHEILEDEEDEKNLPIFYKINDDAIIWKLRAFNLTEGKVDEMMKTVRKHKTLILDLRGNGGGLC